jgi:hypothetical protein
VIEWFEVFWRHAYKDKVNNLRNIATAFRPMLRQIHLTPRSGLGEMQEAS